jgi:hypothetical protein
MATHITWNLIKKQKDTFLRYDSYESFPAYVLFSEWSVYREYYYSMQRRQSLDDNP